MKIDLLLTPKKWCSVPCRCLHAADEAETQPNAPRPLKVGNPATVSLETPGNTLLVLSLDSERRITDTRRCQTLYTDGRMECRRLLSPHLIHRTSHARESRSQGHQDDLANAVALSLPVTIPVHLETRRRPSSNLHSRPHVRHRNQVQKNYG